MNTPFCRGDRYYKGYFNAFCSVSGISTTFFAADHGAYPWGRSFKDGSLANICHSLGIKTNSGVFNCCLFVHFLVSILERKLTSIDELLSDHEALLRKFLCSKILRNDDDVINFAMKDLKISNNVCIRFIAKIGNKFCISPQIFGSPSGSPIFLVNVNKHFFIGKIKPSDSVAPLPDIASSRSSPLFSPPPETPEIRPHSYDSLSFGTPPEIGLDDDCKSVDHMSDLESFCDF